MSSKIPEATDIFVGQRVRAARVMAGMSQEKLGDALSLTFQQIQKYEKGKNRISASRLDQLSKILGRPVSWFFDEQGTAKDDTSDVCARMITAPGGIKLARAYLKIKHNKERATVAQFAEALASRR